MHTLKTTMILRRSLSTAAVLFMLAAPLFAQGKRLWVLRAPGEMAEYDPITFALKHTVKVPAEAVKSPAAVSVNRLGQILYAPVVTLPLTDQDVAAHYKVWIWDGHSVSTIDQGVTQKTEKTGSNDAITETAPTPLLAAGGTHLFWFANQERRLQREEVDLSVETTLQLWQTDLSGANREEIVSSKLPDCRCSTGNCEETCPSGSVWAPDRGVEKFVVVLQSFSAQTGTVYKASTSYRLGAGNMDAAKWSADPTPEPLQRVLDADASGTMILEAIPDTACCGWSNQSNDQTLVFVSGKKVIVFDEQATYKNPDYDVSFFTLTGRLSPESGRVAMTIATTAQINKPIQLSEEGAASPEESLRIRKAVAEMPAVVVKTVEDNPKQIAFLPHTALVGWISEKELLILEDHLLVTYNVETGARKKSTIKVEDAAHVFLR